MRDLPVLPVHRNDCLIPDFLQWTPWFDFPVPRLVGGKLVRLFRQNLREFTMKRHTRQARPLVKREREKDGDNFSFVTKIDVILVKNSSSNACVQTRDASTQSVRIYMKKHCTRQHVQDHTLPHLFHVSITLLRRVPQSSDEEHRIRVKGRRSEGHPMVGTSFEGCNNM